MNLPNAIARLLSPCVAACILSACATQHAGQPPAPGQAPVNDPNALVLGAEMALQKGEYLEASKAYLRAAQASQGEDLAEQATRIAFENRQWSIAEEAADHWLQINQTNEEGQRYAAFSALHLYQLDRSAEHLELLLESAFINPAAGYLALLPQLSDEGTPAAVTAVLQRLLDKHADVAEAHYALAQAAIQSDNFALA